MPNKKDNKLSVARHSGIPVEEAQELANEYQVKDFYGSGVLIAKAIREESLELDANEPPPRHADIVGWPELDDPDLTKAKHKELAAKLAQEASKRRHMLSS